MLLGDNDGVGVGHWDNDGRVGRHGGLVGHRAGGGGVDLGGLVRSGQEGGVVNNGSWDLGDDGRVRGLGEGHWDAADGRGDGVWARNSRRDVVDISNSHSGAWGGNDISDGGGDLDGHNRGGRVDNGDDLAGLSDGLGDWAQRGGVLSLNSGVGDSRVGLLDGDWDGGVNHIRDGRGGSVGGDLGGATVSPEDLLERLPLPRRETRYSSIRLTWSWSLGK